MAYSKKKMIKVTGRAVKKSVGKSFKSGKAKSASARGLSKGNLLTARVSKKGALAKGAARAGRAYKMTAKHRAAISRALKKR